MAWNQPENQRTNASDDESEARTRLGDRATVHVNSDLWRAARSSNGGAGAGPRFRPDSGCRCERDLAREQRRSRQLRSCSAIVTAIEAILPFSRGLTYVTPIQRYGQSARTTPRGSGAPSAPVAIATNAISRSVQVDRATSSCAVHYNDSRSAARGRLTTDLQSTRRVATQCAAVEGAARP